MKLYLYNSEDDEIVLNKTLKDEKEIEIDFKATYNRIDTQIILNYKKGAFNPNQYNYVSMDSNYYFIVNKEFIDNENVIYYLHQDVYMTNKGTIMNRICGVLDRSGSKFNRYINDENLVLANQKRVQTKKFSKSFKANNNAILIVTSD